MFTRENNSLSATSAHKKQPVNMDDIRAKLNFSSSRSPLVIRSSYSKISPPINRRLNDYHMSRQNPAVLDHLCGNGDLLPDTSNNYKSSLPRGVKLNNSVPQGSGILSPYWPQPIKLTSVMKGSSYSPLNDGRSGLVQLATRRFSPFHHTRTSQTSPILVKLAYPDKKNNSSLSPSLIDTEDKESIKTTPLDPCDKNVIVSALKQKRKRWWSSVTVSPPNGSLNGMECRNPLSKKPKTSQDISKRNREEEESSLAANKRLTDSSQPLKKPKHVASITATTTNNNSFIPHIGRQPKKLILPDMEIEVSPLPSPAQMEAIVERKRKDNKTDRKMAENTNDEKKRKCDTPPVEEEGVSHQEERLLKLKREATLKLTNTLTKVYPSPTRGTSIRKKVPILCTTGSRPHMVSHGLLSATQEALKKDKEAVSNRIRSLLMSDDPEEPKDDQLSVTTVSSLNEVVGITSLTAPSVSQTASLASVSSTTSIPSLSSSLGVANTTRPSLPSLQINFPSQIKTSASSSVTLGMASSLPSLSTQPSLLPNTSLSTQPSQTSLSTQSSLSTQPSLLAQSSLSTHPSLLAQSSLSTQPSLLAQTSLSNQPSLLLLNTSLSTQSSLLAQPSLPTQPSLSANLSFTTSLSSLPTSVGLSSTQTNTSNVLLNSPLSNTVQQQRQSSSNPVLALNPLQQNTMFKLGQTSMSSRLSLGLSVAATVVTTSITNPIVAFSNQSSIPTLGTMNNSALSLMGQSGSEKGQSLQGPSIGIGSTLAANGGIAGGITLKPFSLNQPLAVSTTSNQQTIGNGLQANTFNFGLNQSSLIFSKMQANQQGIAPSILQPSVSQKPTGNIFNSQPMFNQSNSNPAGINSQPMFNQSNSNPAGINLLQQQNNAFNPNQNTQPGFSNFGITTTNTQQPSTAVSKESSFKFSLGANTSNSFASNQPQMSFGSGLFNQTQQQKQPTAAASSTITTTQSGFNFSINNPKPQGIPSMFGGLDQQQQTSQPPQTSQTPSFQLGKQQPSSNNFQFAAIGNNNMSANGGGLGFSSNKVGQQQQQQQSLFAFGGPSSQQQQQQQSTLQGNNNTTTNSPFNFTMGKQQDSSTSFGQNVVPSPFGFSNQNTLPNGMNKAVPSNSTPFGGGGGNQTTNQNSFFQFGTKGTGSSNSGGVFGTNQQQPVANQTNNSFQFLSAQATQQGYNFGQAGGTTPSRGASVTFAAGTGNPRPTIQARRRKK